MFTIVNRYWIFLYSFPTFKGLIKGSYNGTYFLAFREIKSPAVPERQASTFTVELLLPDALLQEYSDCTLDRLAKFTSLPLGIEILKQA